MQRTEARDSLESRLSREPEGPHVPSADTWPPTLGKDSDSDSVGRTGVGWGQESGPKSWQTFRSSETLKTERVTRRALRARCGARGAQG